LSRGQNLLEVLVSTINSQICDISQDEPKQYLYFVGTLFIFIAASNSLTIIPGYHPPTGSLSTTAALAACVFIAIPIYGVREQGFSEYFQHYIKPSPIMLPFNIIGELSRTLALAVRLFGNVMSGSLIAGILLLIAPLFFPLIMQALALLIGLIQAYIFAVLAMVYIASATRARREGNESNQSKRKDN
jgi:F-type H+-transporting ATPase subunit a